MGGAAGSNQGSIVDLSIQPGPTTLVVTNGVKVEQTFQAVGLFSDGTSKPVQASWSFDRLDLGQVTPGSGVLTAAGDKGGQGTLTASAEGLAATTVVTVKLVFTENPGGVTPEEQAQLEVPGGLPGGALLYPYDRTVFARGLLAPELMWSGGSPGDKYLVRIQQSFVESKFWITADPPSGYTMPQKAWDELTTSNVGEDVQVEVVRLSGGVVHAPMKQSWKIAQGSLRGSIQYWAVNTGQIMKINPGSKTPVVAFDSGASAELGSPAPANYNGNQPPWSSGGGGKRCITCHVTSKDGSRLVGALQWDGNGNFGRPWATVDLNTGAYLQVSDYGSRDIFFALTPEGKYVVRNPEDLTLRMADAVSGAGMSSLLDGFTDKLADPAFAPNGKLMAFAGNVNGSYPVEFWRSDLDVVDFDPQSATFSNRRQLVPGGNLAIAFPSFSPDSEHVVYQKGTYSRANYGEGLHGIDDLYLTSVLPGLGEIALDKANGVGMVEERNLHRNYQPTVNPIAVGGYFWVVFVSPRDYGNKMLSTTNPSYQNRKQLWVTAVNINPKPGEDPSSPAFWLPGQDLSTINMSGYWALEPCKQQGNSCNEGFECCSGFCRQDGSGNFVCSEPPAGGCSQIGEKCVNQSDCCDPGAECIGGFCAQGKP
jgi:hypothetical protein